MSDWPIPSNRSLIWKVASTIWMVFLMIVCKIWIQILNKIKCYNSDTLLKLVDKREIGRSLITVANHDSCLDDPLLIAGALPFRIALQLSKIRWSLGAKEICHTTKLLTKLFCWGQVIPIVRGDGIYQKAMDFAIEELQKGGWIHLFPEGRVNEKKENIRYKWGVARLIMDLKVPPIVLPIYHRGMDDVLPNVMPYKPLRGKKVTLLVGQPILFDNLLNKLRREGKSNEEIRITLTAKIQEEMNKLKPVVERLHKAHLENDR